MNISKLFEGCRSYRRFEQKPIPHELLTLMAENARLSNSARNAQTLRYVFVETPEKVAAMQPLVKWAAKLPPEIGTPKPGEQPTAFVVITVPADAGKFDYIDLGIAARTLTLTAWEAGVGSCMMSNINPKKIASLLDVPDDRHPELVISLGYPAHESTIVDVPESGDLSYYVDEQRDYFVPKRALGDIAKFV